MTDLRPVLRAMLRDPALTCGDRVIAWTIASYANGGAQAWPSLDRLYKDTGLHVRSIRRIIDRLAGHGVFTVLYRPGRPTVYTFTDHPSVRPTAQTNGHEMSTGLRPSAQTECAPVGHQVCAGESQSVRPSAQRSIRSKKKQGAAAGVPVDDVPAWLAERWADRLAVPT